MLESLKTRSRKLKLEVTALAYAQRHPDTPPAAKVLAVLVVAYALSPIDLIPDFIPVLGLLDDLLLLPLGIYWALKLIPAHVMAEARERATAQPPSVWGAAAIILVWLVLSGLVLYSLFRRRW